MDYQIKLKNYLSKTMWDKSRKWAKSLEMIKETYEGFAWYICRIVLQSYHLHFPFAGFKWDGQPLP